MRSPCHGGPPALPAIHDADKNKTAAPEGAAVLVCGAGNYYAFLME
jgi:hypothetical protein